MKRSIPSPDWGTPRAVIANGFIFLSGTTSKHPDGYYLAADDIVEQTNIVLDRIEADLKAAGSSLDDVVKVTVFLRDIKQWKEFNETYLKRFGKNRPARTTIQAGGFEDGACIEMDVIAIVAESDSAGN
ncbi:MAG: RidA family protein [Aggregatilineales bacterium]|nr:RidA family protein [Bacillota bacterium]